MHTALSHQDLADSYAEVSQIETERQRLREAIRYHFSDDWTSDHYAVLLDVLLRRRLNFIGPLSDPEHGVEHVAIIRSWNSIFSREIAGGHDEWIRVRVAHWAFTGAFASDARPHYAELFALAASILGRRFHRMNCLVGYYSGDRPWDSARWSMLVAAMMLHEARTVGGLPFDAIGRHGGIDMLIPCSSWTHLILFVLEHTYFSTEKLRELFADLVWHQAGCIDPGNRDALDRLTPEAVSK